MFVPSVGKIAFAGKSYLEKIAIISIIVIFIMLSFFWLMIL